MTQSTPASCSGKVSYVLTERDGRSITGDGVHIASRLFEIVGMGRDLR